MIAIGDVRERLSEIRPAGLNRDIITAGLVRDVRIDGATVVVSFMPGPLPNVRVIRSA